MHTQDYFRDLEARRIVTQVNRRDALLRRVRDEPKMTLDVVLVGLGPFVFIFGSWFVWKNFPAANAWVTSHASLLIMAIGAALFFFALEPTVLARGVSARLDALVRLLDQDGMLDGGSDRLGRPASKGA